MVVLKSVSPPTDGVRHEQAETSAILDGKGLGCGTLYVAETRLSWFDGTGMGFSLEYPTIGLHAISRDLGTYPQEHLYVMVNAKLNEHGRGDIPSFYTCEEGLSSLNSEGEATLSRLEGMLARSVAQQFHMAGVRTDNTGGDFEDGMDVEGGSAEAGQFEDADADVDHW
uniref:Methylosome subunit pICln n=1 Tax=Gadus morhua TaxID=8049 RepID=A0A8C5BUF1_GADMO